MNRIADKLSTLYCKTVVYNPRPEWIEIWLGECEDCKWIGVTEELGDKFIEHQEKHGIGNEPRIYRIAYAIMN